jgi:hypothetical protein
MLTVHTMQVLAARKIILNILAGRGSGLELGL